MIPLPGFQNPIPYLRQEDYAFPGGLILGTAVVALLVQGCKATPTEPEITIEDLFSHLNIAMGSITGGGGGISADVIPPGFDTPPLDHEIQALGPNTNVFQPSWPIIDDFPIRTSPFWSGAVGDGVIAWEALAKRTFAHRQRVLISNFSKFGVNTREMC